MSLRSCEIYVSFQTKRRLRWIQKAESPDTATQDQIGDRLLNERIEELYPNIKDLERKFDTAETELIAELGRQNEQN